MPVLETKGAISAQGFGLTLGAAEPVYIENVFQTWLYTGTGASLTITNGIDLAGKGGLVWLKQRSAIGDSNNYLVNTVSGISRNLTSNNADAQQTFNLLSSVSSTGYVDNVGWTAGATVVSWTFREQPKFFDVVTYTGNGSIRTIAHNLGSVPGCVMVKCSSNSGDWVVWHRSAAALNPGNVLKLNSTNAQQNIGTVFNSTSPTSTEFTVGTSGDSNANGATYVAYLFAHDAGGFGLTGTDNVISCGSFTTDGSGNATINLGYEPQWVLVKPLASSSIWYMIDSMRGNSVLNGSNITERQLEANTSLAESGTYGVANPTSTGFVAAGWGTTPITFIYIAIRRGPMKVPTTGTSVFQPRDPGNAATTVITTNFPVDMQIVPNKKDATHNNYAMSRLQGVDTSNSSTSFPYLWTESTNMEATANNITRRWSNTGYTVPIGPFENQPVFYSFGRAPNFMDVVCYTGNGTSQTITHNLAAAPELIIVKRRNTSGSWVTYDSFNGAGKYLVLNSTSAAISDVAPWNNTAPTSSVFSVGTTGGFTATNASGSTYVAYLFASCPGVSKVGEFIGTGATQVINCGFTGGARFVLIKASSTTGDWYVWDTARGINPGNDPYLRLNSTAAEVTNTDWVDTAATGFELSNAAGNLANSNGVTYIFLAIA
jgi:hypothetical protein